MANNTRPRGKCAFCGREMTRGGMARHLRTCPERKDVVQEADHKSGKVQALYHLQVQDAWGGDYWLHLEMNGSAPLSALDRYLRAIWLECCGHLSGFWRDRAWTGAEVSMARRADQVFNIGTTLIHIYDFGTSSETKIKVADARKGKPLTPHPIFLMARNNPPEFSCMECDKPATQLCLECVYELNKSGALCDAHAEGHPHDAYGLPMPIVNSPRVGMCGYTGPAEPPY